MSLNLKKLLESVFPFLFNALQRSWDNLTTAQQNAIVNSGLIGQYLKNNLTALSGDLVKAISAGTGLDTDTVTKSLLALANEFGLNTTDIDKAVSFLQDKLSTASSDAEWNGLLTIILNAGATILSGGTVNWVHVALGLGEFAYQKFIEPKTGITLNIPSTKVTTPTPVPVSDPTPYSDILPQTPVAPLAAAGVETTTGFTATATQADKPN